MKLSWNSLKISIAGAKLSHLVQKDKIWDHGSMTEQVKTVFFKVKKVKNNGNVHDLDKYLSTRCVEKLKKELDDLEKNGKKWVIKNPVIKEVAITEVREGRHNKRDCFVATIKAMGIEFIADKYLEADWKIYSKQVGNFCERWCFVREGDWWLLDSMKSK